MRRLIRLVRAALAWPGDVAALWRDREALPPILPPGLVEITTPAPPAATPLLRTRLSLAGDVVTTIAAPFLALPSDARAEIAGAHQARIAAALAALDRLRRAVLGLAAGGVLAAGGIGGIAPAQAGLGEMLPGLALGLAGATALAWGTRRVLLPWLARRLGARVLRPGQASPMGQLGRQRAPASATG